MNRNPNGTYSLSRKIRTLAKNERNQTVSRLEDWELDFNLDRSLIEDIEQAPSIW